MTEWKPKLTLHLPHADVEFVCSLLREHVVMGPCDAILREVEHQMGHQAPPEEEPARTGTRRSAARLDKMSTLPDTAQQALRWKARLDALELYIDRHCGGIGGVLATDDAATEDIRNAAICENGQPFCEECKREREDK